MHANTIRHSHAKSNAPRNTQPARPNQVPVILISENESMQAHVIAALRPSGLHLHVFQSPFQFEQRPTPRAAEILLIDQEHSLSHEDPFISRCLRQAVPPRLLLLAEKPDTRRIVAAMKAGVVAVLEKPVSEESLLCAVRIEMERPKISGDPAVCIENSAAIPALQNLTDRQRLVAEQIYQGQSNRQIADTLSIAVKTVESHRSQIMARLRLNSVAALIRLLDQMKRS